MKTNLILILFTLVFSFESFGAFPVSEIDSLKSSLNNVNIEYVNQDNSNPKAMTMEVVSMFVLAGLFLGVASIWLIGKLVALYNCADSMTSSESEKNCSSLDENRAVFNLIGVLALIGFVFLFKAVNDYYKNKRRLKKQ
tara:strand:- start:4303 stop:4719 length:417 start_codon:yes stop_codon:yes gene_type:complete